MLYIIIIINYFHYFNDFVKNYILNNRFVLSIKLNQTICKRKLIWLFVVLKKLRFSEGYM